MHASMQLLKGGQRTNLTILRLQGSHEIVVQERPSQRRITPHAIGHRLGPHQPTVGIVRIVALNEVTIVQNRLITERCVGHGTMIQSLYARVCLAIGQRTQTRRPHQVVTNQRAWVVPHIIVIFKGVVAVVLPQGEVATGRRPHIGVNFPDGAIKGTMRCRAVTRLATRDRTASRRNRCEHAIVRNATAHRANLTPQCRIGHHRRFPCLKVITTEDGVPKEVLQEVTRLPRGTIDLVYTRATSRHRMAHIQDVARLRVQRQTHLCRRLRKEVAVHHTTVQLFAINPVCLPQVTIFNRCCVERPHRCHTANQGVVTRLPCIRLHLTATCLRIGCRINLVHTPQECQTVQQITRLSTRTAGTRSHFIATRARNQEIRQPRAILHDRIQHIHAILIRCRHFRELARITLFRFIFVEEHRTRQCRNVSVITRIASQQRLNGIRHRGAILRLGRHLGINNLALLIQDARELHR